MARSKSFDELCIQVTFSAIYPVDPCACDVNERSFWWHSVTYSGRLEDTQDFPQDSEVDSVTGTWLGI